MDLKKEVLEDIEKAQLSAEEILRKYDKESDKRELSGVWNTIINAICIIFCIFQVYTAAFGVLDAQLQRAVHLAFGFALVFLLYPMRASWSRKEMNWIDVGFAVLGVAVTMYIVVFYHDLVLRAGMNNETDYIIALIGTLLVIEGARRVVGWPMITIAILFVLYALFGRMFPGIMAHRGLGLHELVNYLYYTTEGIFGTPMGVSSTFIYLFILFGAYLETTGLGKFFIDISKFAQNLLYALLNSKYFVVSDINFPISPMLYTCFKIHITIKYAICVLPYFFFSGAGIIPCFT